MREIKEGDRVVFLKHTPHPNLTGCISIVHEVTQSSILVNVKPGSGWAPASAMPDFFCLAPDPDYEYKVGDWVLPVVERLSHGCLLEPQKITGLDRLEGPDQPGNIWRLELSCISYAHDDEIVPIRRRADRIYIGCWGETVLTVEEYKQRYGVEELPEDEWKHLKECSEASVHTDDIVQRHGGYREYNHRAVLPERWQPNADDIRECCGVWRLKEGGPLHTVMPDDLLPGNGQLFSDKHDFDRHFRDGTFNRIEPIPEQCVPGYEPPKRETPEWMREAVRLYPSQGEWD